MRRSFKTKKMTKKRKIELIFTVAAIIIASVMFCLEGGKTPISADAQAEFHFIDVGQGDGAMIITDEVTVVVDCGTAAGADDFKEYINRYTDKIDCLVLSHPHDDHMGAAAEVIEAFEVGEVIMTDYASDSAFFGRALDAIEKHGVKLTEAIPGEESVIGDAKLEFFAPIKDYGDANNNSIVMKATVDGASVLFTGDAEEMSEYDILERYAPKLSSHILKLGHHGSSTSTTEEFFSAVSPEYAVVSCGKDNSYGHPHRETVALLKKYGTPTYRTDVQGDIVFIIKDGRICKPAD